MVVEAHDSVGTSEHALRTMTGIPVEVMMKRLIWVLASVPAFTVAVIVRVADVPLATVPMLQTPVVESYVPAPWVVAATKVTPAGSVSVAVTPVASAVPSLATPMV